MDDGGVERVGAMEGAVEGDAGAGERQREMEGCVEGMKSALLWKDMDNFNKMEALLFVLVGTCKSSESKKIKNLSKILKSRVAHVLTTFNVTDETKIEKVVDVLVSESMYDPQLVLDMNAVSVFLKTLIDVVKRQGYNDEIEDLTDNLMREAEGQFYRHGQAWRNLRNDLGHIVTNDDLPPKDKLAKISLLVINDTVTLWPAYSRFF